jgi:hypothetical protein
MPWNGLVMRPGANLGATCPAPPSPLAQQGKMSATMYFLIGEPTSMIKEKQVNKNYQKAKYQEEQVISFGDFL